MHACIHTLTSHVHHTYITCTHTPQVHHAYITLTSCIHHTYIMHTSHIHTHTHTYTHTHTHIHTHTYTHIHTHIHTPTCWVQSLLSPGQLMMKGIISIGTHGSGINFGNMATLVTRIELVTGEGEIVVLSQEDSDTDSFRAAQVPSLTFCCSDMFL